MGNRGVFLLIGGIMMFSLFGCGKESAIAKKTYTDQTIIPVIEEELNHKYGETFKVKAVNKSDDGINFSQLYFTADATCESTRTDFQLRIENDGTKLNDNYEGYLFRSSIEKDIDEIFISNKDIHQTRAEVEYLFSDSVSGSLEQYQLSGNAILQAGISVDAKTSEEAADVIFGFIDELQNRGYSYSLDIEWNGKTVILYKEGKYEKTTHEQIRRKLEG